MLRSTIARRLLAGALLCILATAAQRPAGASSPSAPVSHGIDPASFDQEVSPCQDFFQHCCGGWIKSNPIPPDYSRWGVWNSIEDRNLALLRKILEEAAAKGDAATKLERKLGDLWRTGMNQAALEKDGMAPIAPELARIDKIKDRNGLLDVIAHLHHLGVNALFRFESTQDFKDSTQVIGEAHQGGLGLPDRDDYLREDEPSRKLREAYAQYVTDLLVLSGLKAPDAQAGALAILALETRLARASMTRVDRRDPEKTYHKMGRDALAHLANALRWDGYIEAQGVSNRLAINVAQPDFFKEASACIDEVPLDRWKVYLRFHLLDSVAPYLAEQFENLHFHFHGVVQTGKKSLLPRWKRVVHTVDGAMGEALGASFVARAFPPEAKAKAQELVGRLETALRQRLTGATWLAADTRTKALAKLDAFTRKIGYPDKWRDYTKLTIDRGPYVLNVLRAVSFEHDRDMAKIGKPLDRSEWYMSPPTINAYYDPSMNEIVFPAGILQPPLFDPAADDAINLGGIGVIIGHEMGHGFDDQGAKFDAKGNMENWWTPADLASFKDRTECVAKQFDDFTVVDGLHLKGHLVVGEAVGDLNGATLAYRALESTLQPGPHTAGSDGFTPEQRFFIAFAQAWAQHSRPEQERMLAQIDPHPPARYRVNGSLQNMPEFHQAFDCTQGQPMVRADQVRCKLWE